MPLLILLVLYVGATVLGIVFRSRDRRADERLAAWRVKHDGPFADLRELCHAHHPGDRSWDYGVDELVRMSSRPPTSTPNPSYRHKSGGYPWPRFRSRDN